MKIKAKALGAAVKKARGKRSQQEIADAVAELLKKQAAASTAQVPEKRLRFSQGEVSRIESGLIRHDSRGVRSLCNFLGLSLHNFGIRQASEIRSMPALARRVASMSKQKRLALGRIIRVIEAL